MPNGCLNATPQEVLKRNEYPGGLGIPSDTQKNINEYPGGLAIPSDTQKKYINEYPGGLAIPSDTQKRKEN
jgi:hypothetical protein